MKNAILSFLMIFSVAASSQTEQGRILLGGSLGFVNFKNNQSDTLDKVLNTTKNSSLAIDLRGGYFFADNIAAGLLIGFNNNKDNVEYFSTPPAKTINEDRNNTFSIGLFGRMYTTPSANRFSFFAQLNFAYFTGRAEKQTTSIDIAGVSTSKTSHQEINGLGLSVNPGVAFFLSDRIALEALFGALAFSSTNYKDFNTSGRPTGTSKISRLEATVSPSTLRLGISFYLGGGGESSGGGKK
jgi:hypothetical protein